MKKQEQTFKEKFDKIQKIGIEVTIPWNVARLTNPKGSLYISGNQICIGTDEADYGSPEECQTAIEWYVQQLGGSVTWQSNKKTS